MTHFLKEDPEREQQNFPKPNPREQLLTHPTHHLHLPQQNQEKW